MSQSDAGGVLDGDIQSLVDAPTIDDLNAQSSEEECITLLTLAKDTIHTTICLVEEKNLMRLKRSVDAKRILTSIATELQDRYDMILSAMLISPNIFFRVRMLINAVKDVHEIDIVVKNAQFFSMNKKKYEHKLEMQSNLMRQEHLQLLMEISLDNTLNATIRSPISSPVKPQSPTAQHSLDCPWKDVYMDGYRAYYGVGGVPKNYVKAFNCFRNAYFTMNSISDALSVQDSEYVMLMSDCYFFGLGTEKNFSLGQKYLERAAIANNAEAIYRYAVFSLTMQTKEEPRSNNKSEEFNSSQSIIYNDFKSIQQSLDKMVSAINENDCVVDSDTASSMSLHTSLLNMLLKSKSDYISKFGGADSKPSFSNSFPLGVPEFGLSISSGPKTLVDVIEIALVPACRGHADAQLLIGCVCELLSNHVALDSSSDGFDASCQLFSLALFWFSKSIDNGSAMAFNSLGLLFFENKNLERLLTAEKNNETYDQYAKDLINQSMDSSEILKMDGGDLNHTMQEHSSYIKNLHLTYEDNTKVPNFNDREFRESELDGSLVVGAVKEVQTKYPRIAFKLFQHAALAGCASAYNNLGTCYEHSIGTVGSVQHALHSYYQGAEAGSAQAMYSLGYLLTQKYIMQLHQHQQQQQEQRQRSTLLNYSYTKDAFNQTNDGLKWLRRASDNGVLDAGFQLGLLFEKGQGGVPRDMHTAYSHYTAVAHKGHVAAAFHAANLIFFERLPVDSSYSVSEMIRLYKQAADASMVEAMVSLGDVYSATTHVTEEAFHSPSASISPANTVQMPPPQLGLMWYYEAMTHRHLQGCVKFLKSFLNMQCREKENAKYLTNGGSEGAPSVLTITSLHGEFVSMESIYASVQTLLADVRHKLPGTSSPQDEACAGEAQQLLDNLLAANPVVLTSGNSH